MPQLITPNNMRGGGMGGPAPVRAQVLDVGKQPEVKSALLSGRIQGLTAPFMYHDPSKEIAYVLMPMEMNLRDTDQQRLIGQMTQSIMRGLPDNTPKAYLLQPKMFFTFQSLVEAILEKDGISKEMLEEQRIKSELLRDWMRMTDEKSIRDSVKKNADKVDAAVFELLSMNIEAAMQRGIEQAAQQLTVIEKILLEESPYGKKMLTRASAIETLQKSPTRETLLDQLITAPDSETREVLVQVGYQLLDYQFFQLLSTKIDATPDQAGKNALIAVRKEVQEIRVKLENAQKDFMRSKADLINKILSSQDPLATAREHEKEIDEDFLAVVEANMQSAQQQGQRKEMLQAFEMVYRIAMQIMTERQPVEVQIMNALMQAQFPDETQQILEQIRDEMGIDDRFCAVMGKMAEQLAGQDRTEASARITQVMIQARSILPKYDPAQESASPQLAPESRRNAPTPPPAPAPAPSGGLITSSKAEPPKPQKTPPQEPKKPSGLAVAGKW
ncbi:MAG: hypothetical protein KGS46_19810 [Chloroflexi bacterium]|jgi:hypothetical protein|nr:hypothetical protein [Chloroflexota bacterium]